MPGCPELTYDRFCEKHKAGSQREYDKTRRDTDADRFYHSARWKKVRAMHLSRNPLCVVCGMPATMVDHIIEIRDGGCRLCDDNLQSMCIPCHNRKTKKGQ